MDMLTLLEEEEKEEEKEEEVHRSNTDRSTKAMRTHTHYLYRHCSHLPTPPPLSPLHIKKSLHRAFNVAKKSAYRF